MASSPKLILIDHHSNHWHGHNAELLKCFSRHHQNFEAFVHRDLPNDHRDQLPNIHRIFKTQPHKQGNIYMDFFRQTITMFTILATKVNPYTQNALLFFQDGSHRNLFAASLYAILFRRNVIVYFHVIESRFLFKLWRALGFSHSRKIRLVGISQEIAQEISKITKSQIVSIPVPKIQHSLLTESQSFFEHASPQSIRIAIPGAYAKWKSFDTLVDAVSQMMQDARFANCIISLPESLRRPLQSRTNSFESCGCQIQYRPDILPENDYHNLLAQSDAVILNYNQNRYRSIVSGVAEDAFILGTPILITNGTYTYRTYKDKGACIGFDNGDFQSLIECINEFILNQKQFKIATQEIMRQMINERSPHRIIKRLHNLHNTTIYF